MMDWAMLLKGALVNGAWLSLTLVVLMLISGRIAADMWVGDYPPDIREKYGPMSARARRVRPYFAVVFFAAALGIPLLGLAALRSAVGHLAFLPALAFGAVSVLVFNVFDLLILDWLLFCTIQPRMIVLPGTEGMAGYRDYRFHAIGFLKGLAFCVFGGLVIALLWLGLQALLG